MSQASENAKQTPTIALALMSVGLLAYCANERPHQVATGTEDSGSEIYAGVCGALGDVCRDDHAGTQPPTTQECCEGSFCGPWVCTNSVPSHCISPCVCAQPGQSCREELKGKVLSEHPCCDGLSCTGCLDVDADQRFCVCR